MSSARFIVSDVYEAMAKMPDNSVDLIVTSPPFLALRSYLPADHPDKHKEIGSEPTPAAFLTTLLALTREWRRILTPTGSLCVELGDTYSGSGGAGGDYLEDGWRGGQPKFRAATRQGTTNSTKYSHDVRRADAVGGRGWPLDKSLCLIPSLYAGSLAYGRNLLQPDDQLEPWRVRNLIVWHRPNPPVGALGDKVRPSTSYVTVACTAKDRWFDLDSERTEHKDFGPRYSTTERDAPGQPMQRFNKLDDNGERIQGNPAGAPLLDCWTIPTAPYAGSHYATFPPALPRRLINLMCPRQVCVVCGEPRRRITGEAEYVSTTNGAKADGIISRGGRSVAGLTSGTNSGVTRQAPTLGWTDCECPCRVHDIRRCTICTDELKWRRGIVCDPFAGSGTTLQAASELGRDSIGIDLDRRNLELARQRLGMFLVEEDEVVA